MPINYNTIWLNGSYENDAFHFIGWFENPALMTASGAKLAAHFEGTSIAIGFGYDLIQNRNRAQSDLANVGLTIMKKTGVRPEHSTRG